MIKRLCVLAAVSLTLGCKPAMAPPEEHKEVAESSLIRRVVDVLEANGRSGSLVYHGECTALGMITDSFTVRAPERRVPAMQALQNAFANEPRLAAKEDSSGLIRVVGGNVQTDLLDLRIHQIVFHAETNPRDATYYTLLNLPEIKAYMQAHHISFVSTMRGLAPGPKGAHLTATLKDVTLSQALDRIAQTFPGVWIYRECSTAQGERLVDFTFDEF